MLRSNGRSCQSREYQATRWADLFRERWPGLAAKCNGRIEGAIRIYRDHGAPLDGQMPGEYIVHSESQRSHYVVDVIKHSCSCMDHAMQPGLVCKHRLVTGWILYGDQWAGEEAKHLVHVGTGATVVIEARKGEGIVIRTTDGSRPFRQPAPRSEYLHGFRWSDCALVEPDEINEVVS